MTLCKQCFRWACAFLFLKGCGLFCFIFPFLPFFHSRFPVGLLSALHSFLLTLCLVAGLVASTFGFHVGNSGIVENGYRTAFYCSVQLFFAEGLTLLVEIGYVKLITHSQVVTYLLLLCTVAGILQSQQSTNLLYLFLRKFGSSP